MIDLDIQRWKPIQSSLDLNLHPTQHIQTTNTHSMISSLLSIQCFWSTSIMLSYVMLSVSNELVLNEILWNHTPSSDFIRIVAYHRDWHGTWDGEKSHSIQMNLRERLMCRKIQLTAREYRCKYGCFWKDGSLFVFCFFHSQIFVFTARNQSIHKPTDELQLQAITLYFLSSNGEMHIQNSEEQNTLKSKSKWMLSLNQAIVFWNNWLTWLQWFKWNWKQTWLYHIFWIMMWHYFDEFHKRW